MSDETAAIVGIYGEVDRAVSHNPIARLEVAQLLSPYRDPELRWYDDFLKWLEETGEPGVEGSAFLDVKGALGQLAETQPARPRMRARRMFAIAVAARAFPEMKEEGNELRELAIAALRVIPGPAEPEKQADLEKQAEGLYKVLAGEERLMGTDHTEGPGTEGWWNGVVGVALDAQVIRDTAGMYPKPCTGRWVTVPGIEGPVNAIQTEVLNDEIDFDRATRFLEPLNWKTCMPSFWRAVDLIATLPDGRRKYREYVSSDEQGKLGPGFWAETELLFNFMWVPERRDAKAAVANYQLAEGRPFAHDRIILDEGTLVVSKVKGKKLLVTTTKRVKFSHEFVPGALALIICALGYADVSADLLSCAAARGVDPPNGTDFPGVPVTNLATSAGGPQAARSGGGPGGGSGGGPFGGFFQETADIWARAMREGAQALERGFGASGQQRTTKRTDRREG